MYIYYLRLSIYCYLLYKLHLDDYLSNFIILSVIDVRTLMLHVHSWNLWLLLGRYVVSHCQSHSIFSVQLSAGTLTGLLCDQLGISHWALCRIAWEVWFLDGLSYQNTDFSVSLRFSWLRKLISFFCFSSNIHNFVEVLIVRVELPIS